jgi:VWFA-related protein
MRQALGLLCTLALALPSQAQDTPPKAGGFGSDITVQLVTVEVRVDDRKGRPVTDLEKSAFSVFVDGQALELAHFERVTPEAKASAGPDAPPPLEISSWLAIYLDRGNLRPQGVKRVAAGLDAFLAGPLPADLKMLVVGQDPTPRILQGLTTDKTAVRAAVAAELARDSATAQAMAVRGGKRIFTEIVDTHRLFNNDCEWSFTALLGLAKDYASTVSGRVEQTIAGLDEIARFLQGLPGRKTLLYVADTLELQPGVEALHYVTELCPERAGASTVSAATTSLDRTNRYRRFTQAATAGGVTIYTVEALGLQTDVDLETTESFLKPSFDLDHFSRANRQAGLFLLAKDTGGEALLNANELAKPMAEMGKDMESYYLLGFAYPFAGDGETHDVGVKVEGHSFGVRYRPTFRDAPAVERLEGSLVSALLLGDETNPLAVDLTLGTRPEAPLAARASVRIPLEKITLVRDGDAVAGKVRLVVSLRDAVGRWRPARQLTLPVRYEGPEEARASAAADLVIDVDAEAGQYTAAVAVRDEIGGETSFLRRDVKVE